MKIRLVTVVWGREYADVFLRVGLRTLLAEGNASDLARSHQVIYSIYTTQDDLRVLEAEPAFASLREAVDVRLSLFSPAEIDSGNYGSHGIFWNRAVALARRNSEIVFFIIPDVLYAKGTLMRWATRFEAGAGAIFTIGPQVVLETIIPELAERFPERANPCSLDRGQLFDLLFRHFHPLHAAMRHDSARRPPHPEYDLRLVPARGFVIREIVSHPFCLDPRRFSSLRHYGPQDHLDSVAFEPCCTVSVEPLLKRLRGYYRPWPLDEARLSNMAGWWDCFTTAACEYESAFPFDICATDDALWQSDRRRAVAGGRFYRSQILAAGRLYQLFVALRGRQSYKAANLLALAIYAGRLRRRVCLRDGATVLVPSESALAADADRINALLAPGRERELIDLIADHVILRQADVNKSGRLRRLVRRSERAEPSAADALFTARGLPAEPVLGATSHSDAPFAVGPFTVIVVDRVLWRAAPAPADPLQIADATPHAAQPQASAPSHPGTFVVTSWGRRSRFHFMLYYALHVPFLEPFVAILFPVYFARALKNFFRRFSFVRRVLGALRAGPRHLLFAVLRRLAAVPVLGPFLRRARDSLRRRAAQGPLQLPGRVVGLVRRDGATIAWRKARARASDAVATTFKIGGFGVSRERQEVLDEIRNGRALQAIEEVLTEFEGKMGTDWPRSVPLAAVRNLLGVQGVDSDLLERSLVALTRRDPSWGEAWLELGFLYEDRGQADEALSCFARAMNGPRLREAASQSPRPAAIAAAKRGRLLALAKREAEACECFTRALHLDPNQKMIAVEYADVLRRLGKTDLALTYYGDGMFYQESSWSLPPPPRDFGDLRFQRLANGIRQAAAPRSGAAVVDDPSDSKLQRSGTRG